jgi:hypothetical protein
MVIATPRVKEAAGLTGIVMGIVMGKLLLSPEHNAIFLPVKQNRLSHETARAYPPNHTRKLTKTRPCRNAPTPRSVNPRPIAVETDVISTAEQNRLTNPPRSAKRVEYEIPRICEFPHEICQ